MFKVDGDLLNKLFFKQVAIYWLNLEKVIFKFNN